MFVVVWFDTDLKQLYFPSYLFFSLKKEVFKNVRQVFNLESFFYTHQTLKNRRNKFRVIYTLNSIDWLGLR